MSSSLNLVKAFDTVSHMDIDSALQRFGVSPDFVELVGDLYSDAKTHFKLETGETSEIPMTRGVKQGDPLSPLLFNIAMDPMLEAISTKDSGYKWDTSGNQLLALCYADDNGLLTMSPRDRQENLNIVQKFCVDSGMSLNVKK